MDGKKVEMRKRTNWKTICAHLSRLSILLSLTPLAAAQESDHFTVRFDMSSIEKIFKDPQWVIDNHDKFSKEDVAYRLADAWHEGSGYPKDPEYWMERMEGLATKTTTERLEDPAYRLAKGLYESSDLFQAKAIAHVESFLPNLDRIHEETSIFITAFTVPYSFMSQGHSVIDATSPYWKGDLNFTLNDTTHELFHVGYARNHEYRKEAALESDLKNSLVEQLQNEGIATYVGYTIQSVFPCDSPDHSMMDDPDALKERIAMVNNIFGGVDSRSSDETEKISWNDGVMARAYYVSGGHMARTIDQKLGREALKKTIDQGPEFFIQTYNSLVPPEAQIVRIAGSYAEPSSQ